MNMLDMRMADTNWILQCSLLSFIINLISVSYSSFKEIKEKSCLIEQNKNQTLLKKYCNCSLLIYSVVCRIDDLHLRNIDVIECL